jgi:hypothetical protein
LRMRQAMNVLPSRSFSNCPIRTCSDISSAAMSRPIPDSPGCAGQCSRRIELVPSWRAAGLVAGWLLVVCAAMFFGVALPLPARIAICVGVATFGTAGIRSCFLLASRNSIRALDWAGETLVARCGPRHIEMVVEVATGSFRLGRVGWLLWLEGCDGSRPVFIDAGRQEICAIRRLARYLDGVRHSRRTGESGKLIPSGPKV